MSTQEQTMDQTNARRLPPNAPYANALLLQTMQGIEAVLGQKGLETALRAAKLQRYVDAPPPNDAGLDVLTREYARLNEAVEALTGRAAKATLQRIGRAGFRWAVEEQPATLGVAMAALRVLPQDWRRRAVLRAVQRGVMDLVPYAHVEVCKAQGVWVYRDYTCPVCHMRHGPRPLCHLTAGILGEAMVLASGRDIGTFEVVETHCKAQGDDFCRFEIRDRM